MLLLFNRLKLTIFNNITTRVFKSSDFISDIFSFNISLNLKYLIIKSRSDAP